MDCLRTRYLGCAIVAISIGSHACGTAFSTYGTSFESFTPPPFGPVGSFGTLGDNLADGRMLAVTGNTVFVETAVGSRDFRVVASFDSAYSGGSVDPAFVRTSPDGSRIAVGLGFGRPLAVFDTSSLGTIGSPSMLTSANTRYFDVPHYDAAWRNGNELAINYGSSGFTSGVSLLDVDSPVGSPVNPTIITNIGGGSSSVAFDSTGRLYTANGFDTVGGGSDTGHIRAFEASAWAGSAVDFESDGVFIGDVLSGVSLGFDNTGNLLVGGGDFGAEFDGGYAGVISAGAIGDAWLGTPIDRFDSNDLRMLDPLGTGFGFFVTAYNEVTGELIVIDNDFGTGISTWYATVPAPPLASIGIMAFACSASRRSRS